jgi:3D (Asp-Asp-Asp) domain-containing protein
MKKLIAVMACALAVLTANVSVLSTADAPPPPQLQVEQTQPKQETVQENIVEFKHYYRAEYPVSRGNVDRAIRMRVEVTAYNPTDPKQTSGTGLAFDGRVARPFFTIAVDPKVIPLGSMVYVPKYGWGLAHDTGGAIIGHKIDITFDNNAEAWEWGVQTLTILVIPPEKPYKMNW